LQVCTTVSKQPTAFIPAAERVPAESRAQLALGLVVGGLDALVIHEAPQLRPLAAQIGAGGGQLLVAEGQSRAKQLAKDALVPPHAFLELEPGQLSVLEAVPQLEHRLRRIASRLAPGLQDRPCAAVGPWQLNTLPSSKDGVNSRATYAQHSCRPGAESLPGSSIVTMLPASLVATLLAASLGRGRRIARRRLVRVGRVHAQPGLQRRDPVQQLQNHLDEDFFRQRFKGLAIHHKM
jgi:hypothetical protein